MTKPQIGLSKIRSCDIVKYTTIDLSLQTVEGSHSGLVRPPAKRLPWETGVVGSNPTPSATKQADLLKIAERGF